MLDTHAPFIIASYAVTLLVIGGLIVKILADHRTQKRALAELEARGVGRSRRDRG